MARVVVPFTPFSTKSPRAALAIATCLAGFGPLRPIALTSSVGGRTRGPNQARARAWSGCFVQHFHPVLDRNGAREHGADRAVLLLRQIHGLGHGSGVDTAAAHHVFDA